MQVAFVVVDVFADIVTQGDTHAQLRIQSYVSSAEPVELGSRHHGEVSVLVFANLLVVGIAIKVAFLPSIDKDSAYANPRLQVIEVLCSNRTEELIVLQCRAALERSRDGFLENIEDLGVG